MNDFTATLVYTQLDDFFKARQRALGLRVEHFNAFPELWRPTLLRSFPRLPSYKRLCAWVQKAEQLLTDFAKSNLAEPGDRLSRYAIDSTKVDPHKDKHFPKSLRKATGSGRTHEGWFTGFKLHALVDMKGRVVAADLSEGGRHDLDPVKGGLLDGVKGVVLADSGYVSAQVRQELWGAGPRVGGQADGADGRRALDVRPELGEARGRILQAAARRGRVLGAQTLLWIAGPVLPKPGRPQEQGLGELGGLSNSWKASLINEIQLLRE